MNLFGGGKKKKAGPTLTESIQQLREAMDTLEKREQHITKQIQVAFTEAKKKSKLKDKRGALFQLKRKKMLEKQIDQIYGKKSNIEMQIMTLEAAAGHTEVLSAMRKGAEALKKTVQETDVDKIADVMEDINESMGLADELGDAMAQPIGATVDEDELTAELEEMESDMVNEDLLKAPSVPFKTVESKSAEVTSSATSSKSAKTEDDIKVPTKAPRKEETQEDREMKELEASMGMW